MSPTQSTLAEIRQRIAEEAQQNTDVNAAFGFARALAIIDEEARIQEFCERVDALADTIIDAELKAGGFNMDELHKRISQLRGLSGKNA